MAVQRAYVAPSELRFDPVNGGDGKIHYRQVHMVIQDTGVTPTKFLRASAAHLPFNRVIMNDEDAGVVVSDTALGPGFGGRLGSQEKIEFDPIPIFGDEMMSSLAFVGTSLNSEP